MKSFKKFFSVLTCLCLTIILAFSCLACAPTTNPDDPNTPGGPGQQTCNHDGKIFCDDCDKMVLGDEFFVNYLKSGWNTINKGKAIKYEIKDASIELTPTSAENGYYDIQYETETGWDYKKIDK